MTDSEQGYLHTTIASAMRMTPLLVPPTSGTSPPTNTIMMTSITHIDLGLYVSSSGQESLDHLVVTIVAGPYEGRPAIL